MSELIARSRKRRAQSVIAYHDLIAKSAPYGVRLNFLTKTTFSHDISVKLTHQDIGTIVRTMPIERLHTHLTAAEAAEFLLLAAKLFDGQAREKEESQ